MEYIVRKYYFRKLAFDLYNIERIYLVDSTNRYKKKPSS